MIVRRERRDRYTTVENATIEDERLSFKALGVLTYLLSRPDNWEANADHLSTTHTDGAFSVRGAMRELQHAGYLERRRERQDTGQFAWVHIVHEVPTDGGHHGAVSAKRESHMWDSAPITTTEVTTTEKQVETPSVSPRCATEIVELCEQLAGAIAAHRDGVNRPKVTERWKRDMRLLVERGPLHVDNAQAIPPERVSTAIAFTFTKLAEPTGRDGFCWADQIRSPHALRDHWPQLADAARRLVRQHRRDPLAPAVSTSADPLAGPPLRLGAP